MNIPCGASYLALNYLPGGCGGKLNYPRRTGIPSPSGVQVVVVVVQAGREVSRKEEGNKETGKRRKIKRIEMKSYCKGESIKERRISERQRKERKNRREKEWIS